MGKKNRKIRKLKRELFRLRTLLKESDNSSAKPTGQVSPLAPPGGFPSLPTIAGVEFASASAEVHYKGRDDVMLACLAPGSTAAGVFTCSKTCSAPVLDCRGKIALLAQEEVAQDGLAILANSGNANAFTGSRGVNAVEALTATLSGAMGISPSHILTASTGVIGVPLPSVRISSVISCLLGDLKREGIESSARAIMTTDTFPKGSGTTLRLSNKTVGIAGFAKGSGMISPDMATMLAFIFTDVSIRQSVLQEIVTDINRRTFNSVTVDSDTSTSDTLIVGATGQSGCNRIKSATSPEGRQFAASLELVMEDLAKQLVRDGEGATKFVEIRVTGASSDDDAHRIAKSIANSPLVKTAIAGEDPNWGRIVMAVGKSGANADRDRLSISFGGLVVAENGQVSDRYSEYLAAEYMKNQELAIQVNLGLGAGSALVWTCDLSQAYVSINADYRS